MSLPRNTRSQNSLLSALQPAAELAELREVLLSLRHAGSLASSMDDTGVKAICALVDTVRPLGHAAVAGAASGEQN